MKDSTVARTNFVNLVIAAFIAVVMVMGCSTGGSVGQPAGVYAESTVASMELKPAKVGKGRTPDEKVYEFDVPGGKWVETSLKIVPDQEVVVHHFMLSEQVKVNLGGFTDTRLRTPGKAMPLYTSSNCSYDRGIGGKVPYICVQLASRVL